MDNALNKHLFLQQRQRRDHLPDQHMGKISHRKQALERVSVISDASKCGVKRTRRIGILGLQQNQQ